MTFEELKDKALSLPFAPGVYIMRDAGNKVIYVGKAKKLKNRVSQYFQDSAAHTPKTRAMVSKIDHFDVIVAASEFPSPRGDKLCLCKTAQLEPVGLGLVLTGSLYHTPLQPASGSWK